MNDDQRFFRFIIPGFASLTVTGLAFAITFPRVLCYVTQLEPGGWITAIIGSGGLGFLLSQAYFAFPCSVLDYRKWFQHHSPNFLLASFRVDSHWEIKRLWGQAAGSGPAAKRDAYNLGTFLWQTLIADREKALNGATSRTASRMAAVGATWLGVALGFVGFVVWCSVRWVHALWFMPTIAGCGRLHSRSRGPGACPQTAARAESETRRAWAGDLRPRRRASRRRWRPANISRRPLA
jgi:hypothetical protein